MDPAVIKISPPTPVFPVPTLNTIAPLFPFTALPVFITISPEDPVDVVPVEKLRAPLTPLVPALRVVSFNAPLLVATPDPLLKNTLPPVIS